MQIKYKKSSEHKERAERRSIRVLQQKEKSENAWRDKYAALIKEKDAIGDSYNKLQLTHIDMENKFKDLVNDDIASFFERSRVPTRGGIPRYPWKTTLLVIECLVTGASPRAIENSCTFFPRHSLLRSI